MIRVMAVLMLLASGAASAEGVYFNSDTSLGLSLGVVGGAALIGLPVGADLSVGGSIGRVAVAAELGTASSGFTAICPSTGCLSLGATLHTMAARCVYHAPSGFLFGGALGIGVGGISGAGWTNAGLSLKLTIGHQWMVGERWRVGVTGFLKYLSAWDPYVSGYATAVTPGVALTVSRL